tara:strand:+ start:5209 stop:7485 length:2277 start_codon:yes stop_codon:yes gene_type:complete
MIELTEKNLRIDENTYLRTAKVLDFIIKFLNVNIRLHEANDTIKKGDIFLFNHFSRFETFVPQYLFANKQNIFCRTIAAANLFDDGVFGNYLVNIGAIPHTYPEIINFLTKEINSNIKIIVFPEGAMIKDKSVMDKFGRFSVYSREKRSKRRPHTGAAVIALRVETCRFLYRLALKNNDINRIEFYSHGFSGNEKTGEPPVHMRPTQIVPATITFYPLRISENFLKFMAEHLGNKNKRLIEEMAIEGNLITKNTDMDIHLSAPINVRNYFAFIDKAILKGLYHLKVGPADDTNPNSSFLTKLFINLYEGRIRLLAKRLTDKCMKTIYSHATINLSHIASQMVFYLIAEKKLFHIGKNKFSTILFCVIKEIQKESNLILHPHLKDPERYCSLLEGKNDSLNQFLLMAQEEGLISITEDALSFSPKLLEKFEFDTIRIKNTPKVLYNEAKPIKQLRKIVERVGEKFNKYENERLPEYFYDDDLRIFHQDKKKFSGSDYEDINQRETKILSGEPFFLKSRGVKGRKTGFLLIHGFPASPAEMKPLGKFLYDHGYTVYGVRLKGYGTSPYDLDQTPWEKSIESIEQGYKALSLWCRDVVVVGFSVGAVIALELASQSRDNIRGVVSISAAVEVEGMDNLALIFSAQMEKLVRLIPGVKSKFIEWDTESPQVNYRSLPLQKLADLKNYIEKVKKRLKAVSIPLLIVQATCDPIIKRRSAEFIFETVSSKDKKVYWHESDKHNVVNENCVAVYNNILSFIKELK